MVTKSGGTSTQTKSTTSKAPSTSSGGGGFTSVRDMFDGGGPGRSGSTFQGGPLSNTLNSVGVRPLGSSGGGSSGSGGGGGGADSGQAALGYSPFSLRGLTSKDPANVARNRQAAARYAAIDAARPPRSDSSDSSGISGVLYGQNNGSSNFSRRSGEGSSGENSSAANLATIGAPTVPMGPVEVATPTYGLPSLVPPPGQNIAPPMFSYGAAFQPPPGNAFGSFNPFMNMNLADIFSMYPLYGAQV